MKSKGASRKVTSADTAPLPVSRQSLRCGKFIDIDKLIFLDYNNSVALFGGIMPDWTPILTIFLFVGGILAWCLWVTSPRHPDRLANLRKRFGIKVK